MRNSTQLDYWGNLALVVGSALVAGWLGLFMLGGESDNPLVLVSFTFSALWAVLFFRMLRRHPWWSLPALLTAPVALVWPLIWALSWA